MATIRLKIKSRIERINIVNIFFLSVFLIISLNAIKEKTILHKTFLLSGHDFSESLDADERWYVQTAQSFLAGTGMRTEVDMKYFKKESTELLNTSKGGLESEEGAAYSHKAVPPLYPLFLACCFFVGGRNTLAYFIPQAILASLTCVIIYLLTRDIFKEKRIAVLAGCIMAFYPDLIFWAYQARAETLFIFLLTLGFWCLTKGNSRSNILLIFFTSIIFGLACLTRVTFIPFIPFLFVWEIFFHKKRGWFGFKMGLLIVVGISLFLFPWCLRNFLVFGKFTPFTDEVYTFIGRNDPGKRSLVESYLNSQESVFVQFVSFVKSDLKGYLLFFMKQFIVFWRPFTSSMQMIAKLYKGLVWLFIFPVAFWGMIVSRIFWNKTGVLILFILFYSLLHAASYVDSGLVYRYPIQPFLCIFTAYGIANVWPKVEMRIFRKP